MKIYILEEYNTERTVCVSENINMIRHQLHNEEFFSPEYNDYPILKIWENGVEIKKLEGMDLIATLEKTKVPKRVRDKGFPCCPTCRKSVSWEDDFCPNCFQTLEW